MATDHSTISASDLVIDVQNVTKTYTSTLRRSQVRALRGISMQVPRGSIFGLLGPNGAGKSTLVKILTTVIHPTTAQGTLLGSPLGNKHTLGRVGYLPEHHRFPEYLTAAQVLDYFGALAEVPRKARRRRAGELLETVGIKGVANKKIKTFSKGMRQRLGLANALINAPELVLLDEPTDGVDPVGRREIRQLLLRLRDQGTTIFLNSHLLSELEMVCDHVAILVQGLVRAHGTLAQLTHDTRYDIEVAAEAGLLARLLAHIPAALPEGVTLSINDGVLHLSSDEPALIQPVIDALRGGNVVIKSIRQHRSSLEDLFMKAVTTDSDAGN